MTDNPSIALYVTCLINSFRPQAAFATIELLESLGCTVDVPLEQTCCGQPAYNGGHKQQASEVAKHQIAVLEPYTAIVVPSGSCAGMIRVHYPQIFESDAAWQQRAIKLADKTFELSEFLVMNRWRPRSRKSINRWALHTSCSCLREVKSTQLAEQLLLEKGIELTRFSEPEVCCGFGGAFSTKMDEISSRMGNNKLDQIEAAGADQVISADFGCLMHLEGLASRQSRKLKFHHLAEVLQKDL